MKPGWDSAELKGLSFTQGSHAPHVLLELAREHRVVMVPVGMHEAQAVLEALDPEVPAETAYDVVTELLDSHRMIPQHLEIRAGDNGALTADFVYLKESTLHRLTLSVSRGLAMAAKARVPLYVRTRVAARLARPVDEHPPADRARRPLR
ncbi:MAG: bifunctional nuclease domain-containing protein [Spirochaetaceae bacterium]